MFTAAGSIMVKIDGVKFAEPKFAKGPSDFDVCIHGTSIADPNQGDYFRGEMSQNYGKGNFATQTQAQIPMKPLRAIGFEGDDLTALESQLVGKEVPFLVESREYNGKTYHDVKYIETAPPIVELDATTINARAAALFSKAATPPPPQSAPATGNPFAKKPAATAAAPAITTPAAKLPF